MNVCSFYEKIIDACNISMLKLVILPMTLHDYGSYELHFIIGFDRNLSNLGLVGLEPIQPFVDGIYDRLSTS